MLDDIGNKWSYLVFLALSRRPMRFGEFRIEIEDLSQRALTKTLRSLRRDGFVARELSPPSFRYRLTELGESLIGPVKRLERWAIENKVTILQNRETFDSKNDRS